jgi:hypothetical protein
MRRRPCYKSHMQEYLEKEFPAANTPIPCPVTMQVDRKKPSFNCKMSSLPSPIQAAKSTKPASQHLLVNSNVHVPG